MPETVMQHYSVQVCCWRDKGGCTTFHAVHVHVDFSPHGTGMPKCNGGTGGWSYPPGSPHLQAFRDACAKKFPALQQQVFNCRPISGTTVWSQHAYGNAVDVMTPTVEVGQQVWDWLHSLYRDPAKEDDLTPEQDTRLKRVEQGLKVTTTVFEQVYRNSGAEPKLPPSFDPMGPWPKGSLDVVAKEISADAP